MLVFGGVMVNGCFRLVAWIPGIPENERDSYLGVPRFESQTTGPQTSSLPLVDTGLYKYRPPEG